MKKNVIIIFLLIGSLLILFFLQRKQEDPLKTLSQIVQLVRKSGFTYKDFEMVDSRKSSVYFLTRNNTQYIARMPVIVDTLVSLDMLADSSMRGTCAPGDCARRVSKHSEEAIEIKNICLLFRSIWQTNPELIYLRNLSTDQDGNVCLYIWLKQKSKKRFKMFISPEIVRLFEETPVNEQ